MWPLSGQLGGDLKPVVSPRLAGRMGLPSGSIHRDLAYSVWPVLILPSQSHPACVSCSPVRWAPAGLSRLEEGSLVLGPLFWAIKSTTLLLLASGESPFWCPVQWTMTALLGNQIASNRAKIYSLFLISFPAVVSSPLFLYSTPWTWAMTKTFSYQCIRQ